MNKASLLSTANILVKEQSQSMKEQLMRQKIQGKMRTLALMLNRLYINKVSVVWERVRIIPHRWLKVQLRMKNTIQNIFRKQDYSAKWQGYQRIRRTALANQSNQVLHLQQTLKKQRATSIKLITAFFIGKKRKGFLLMLRKIKQFGDQRQFKGNTNYRSGVRKIIQVYNRKQQQYFNRVKNTKVIIQFIQYCKNMVRTLHQVRNQHTRWAFINLRKEMVRCRKEKLATEIKELEEKLGSGEDEELKGLKERQAQLMNQLQETKKEKDEITAGFEAEVKQAENRNKQMKEKLQQQKAKQEQMKNRILQVDQQLKQPFSLQEIYQLCYQNLLWTISQTTEKTYSKQELLKSLQTPLVPVDLPIGQLKEQNEVLKALLSEYVLMYGQKKLAQNTKIELPYQYLLKENNILYKMLMTLLPNAQFLKEQLVRIKQTFQNVDASLKQLKYK